MEDIMKDVDKNLSSMLDTIDSIVAITLENIKSKFIQSNLPVDDQFREYFLRLSKNRFESIYDRLQLEIDIKTESVHIITQKTSTNSASQTVVGQHYKSDPQTIEFDDIYDENSQAAKISSNHETNPDEIWPTDSSNANQIGYAEETWQGNFESDVLQKYQEYDSTADDRHMKMVSSTSAVPGNDLTVEREAVEGDTSPSGTIRSIKTFNGAEVLMQIFTNEMSSSSSEFSHINAIPSKQWARSSEYDDEQNVIHFTQETAPSSVKEVSAKTASAQMSQQGDTMKRRRHSAGFYMEGMVKIVKSTKKMESPRHQPTKSAKKSKVKSFYICEVENCKYVSNTNWHLLQHMITHSNVKPYKCDYCSKTFRQLTQIQQHTRTHTGEKPYHCKQCPKKFKQLGHLQQHERIHTGEKPYQCKECSRKFTQLNHLRKHMQTRHK